MLYRVNVRWRGDGHAPEEIVLTLDAVNGDAAAAAGHAQVQRARSGSTLVVGVMPADLGVKLEGSGVTRRPRQKAAVGTSPTQKSNTKGKSS